MNLFSHHYRTKFGKPVGKIALGFGRVCPNRAKGGCIYCAPSSFTPYYLEKGGSIGEQIAKGKKFLNTRKFQYYFAYFQQETTTAAPLDELAEGFREALQDERCIGLIISTRPDYVADPLLEELAAIVSQHKGEKEVLIELGLQSARESTLQLLNRNHTYADFEEAYRRIRQFEHLQIGVHLIIGLPGEGSETMRQTVQKVCGLGVDAIKFHHLQVIRGTRLAGLYAEKPFKVYGAREYLEIIAELLPYVPASVVLHRLWSSSDPALLVAPDWGGLGAHQLKGLLDEIMTERNLYQGKYV